MTYNINWLIIQYLINKILINNFNYINKYNYLMIIFLFVMIMKLKKLNINMGYNKHNK